MSITINNGLLVNCISFFLLSVFVSYMLRKAHLFFKPVIFLFLVLLLANVQQEHDLYKTVPVVLGVLLVYSDVIIQKTSELLDLIQDLFYRVKYLVSSVILFILNLIGLVFRIVFYPFRLAFAVLKFIFNPLSHLFGSVKTKRQSTADNGETNFNRDDQQTRSQSQNGREETVNRAKEEFRRARGGEQTESSHESYNEQRPEPKDTRSYHEILGVPQNFTRDDLRKAYKIAASRFHPDHYQHLSESFRKEAEAELVKVNRAYNYLLASLEQ